MKTKINFFKLQKPLLLISLVLVSFSIYSIFFGNKFKLSTDFTGGIEFQVSFEQEVTMNEINKIYDDKKLNLKIVPVLSKKSTYYITSASEEDKSSEKLDYLKTIITDELADRNPDFEKSSLVGAVMSVDNQKAAMRIIIIAIIAEIAYLSFRFKFRYAVAAIVALVHDVIIMLGAVSLLGKEVDILSISAILTILGYSVNDTIILFDRVRENISVRIAPDLKSLMNISINQIIARTLITSLTTFIVVYFLFKFSTGSLNNFSFALIVGIVSGTYSSIYIAATTILVWNRAKPIL